MTREMVRNEFFKEPIIVQIPDESESQQLQTWFQTEIGGIPGVRLLFQVLDASDIIGMRIFHKGDVITGNRVQDFVAYARWLATP